MKGRRSHDLAHSQSTFVVSHPAAPGRVTQARSATRRQDCVEHMKLVAYCDKEKVATVQRVKRRGHPWEICWHRRADSRERIADLATAKQWIAQLLHGKTVDWREE